MRTFHTEESFKKGGGAFARMKEGDRIERKNEG